MASAFALPAAEGESLTPLPGRCRTSEDIVKLSRRDQLPNQR